MVLGSLFLDLNTVTVFLKRSTPFHSIEMISPSLIPVFKAIITNSLSHNGQSFKSFPSSSVVSQRSRLLFSYSIETLATGFFSTHSHPLLAKLKAFFIVASSRLMEAGPHPSFLLLTLYSLMVFGVTSERV